MKLDVLNDSLATTDVAKMSVNVDNLTYSLMIDGIYTNKLDSVIRELSTNARDSHISAGNEDPFLITLTYNENSTAVSLSIKDYGLGLNKEDAEKYLCNLNSSNKRESNEAVGCFGIGSKSPFSLVDSYDFNCIKDGELTNLNLFRIKSETPRFLINTSKTEESNSVECIVKLDSYSLKDILQTIYAELALFDIKPRIHLKSQEVDLLLEPEEFFCTVVITDNFYHLFYKEPHDKIKDFIPTVFENYPQFYVNLKSKKNIACGIIGYNSKDIYTVIENNNSIELQDYYILKFELDSEIKFDVSRENIIKDFKTDNILKNKILSDFESIDLSEALKFKTLYNVIVSQNNYISDRPLLEEFCPDFLLEFESNIFLNSDQTNTDTTNRYLRNRILNYNFLFSKLEESFFYYKNNLDELNLIAFVSKTRTRINLFSTVTNSSKALNYILNIGRTTFTLGIISLLEKIITGSTLIWKELYLENSINLGASFNFLNDLVYNNFLKENLYHSEVKIKSRMFKPKIISDLDSFNLITLINYKRLINIQSLNSFENSFKNFDFSDNKIIVLLSGTKSIILNKNLKSNLNILATKSCFSDYYSEEYSEINPEFISKIKYVAPISNRTVRLASTSDNTEQSVTTHNEFGVKLRNKLLVKSYIFTSKEASILETTSLKFYDFLNKEYEDSFYTMKPKNLILISKDIVRTEEEKVALLENETHITGIKLIFEIDNIEFYDQIKDVCICFLNRWDFKRNKAPIVEFNSKFLNEDILKEYSKILIWIYTKTLNFTTYKNFIESVETDPESQLFSEESEEELLEFSRRHPSTPLINNTILTKKVLSLFKKLNINIDNPYREGTTLYLESTKPINLNFKNISILFNESIIDLEIHSTKNEFYNKEAFLDNYNNIYSGFFDNLNNRKLTTLDSVLCINDNFLYKRLFNLEYLESIQENYNEPLINFNTQSFKKLIKEY